MSKAASLAQSLLLAAALGALVVPWAINAAPALVAPTHAVNQEQLPQAQRVPTQMPDSTGSGLDQSAPMPNPGVLASRLDPLLRTGATYTASVMDAQTGTVLYSKNASTPMIPASNVKLLTAISAVKNLGANHRFVTSVVAGTEPGTVVFKAAGDALLSAGESDPTQVQGRAGLTSLAEAVARSLKEAGVTTVRVQLDDSIFTGPTLNPAWDMGDVQAGETAPIYPAAVNSAFAPAGSGLPRPQDAALAAAQIFATALGQQGITVPSPAQRVSSPVAQDARVLGSVESATVAEQANFTLQESDNYVAEVLARMAALAAHQPGSFTGALTTMKTTLDELGVPTSNMVLDDNTGLAATDRVSAEQFTKVVALITNGPNADVRYLQNGLPIAGLSGTLQGRFSGPTTKQGAGLIKAKTGSLNSVSTLSGMVVDANGRLIVFAILANDVTVSADAVHSSIDQAATSVAECGCSG